MKRLKSIVLCGVGFGLITMALSCKVIKPGADSVKTDSSSISYKPVDVNVKGGKVSSVINVDSLKAELQAYAQRRAKYIIDSANAVRDGRPIPKAPEPIIQYRTDPESKAQLSYWIDEYGKLQVSCESKDQTVNILVAEVSRLTKEVTKKTEVIKETPVWNWIAIAVISTLLVVSVLLNFFIAKRK